MRTTARTIALLAALAIAGARPARADDDTRRTVPDYDGRSAPPGDVVDVLLWIPRILTGPLYLVSEYVIRQPLGALMTVIEQNDVVDVLLSFLTFGPERKIGAFPTAFYDFGFLPSVGIYGYWRDFLVPGNRISLHAATWGADWLSLSIADRATIGRGRVFARGAYLRRPDFVIASSVVFDDASGTRVRYAAESVDGEIGGEIDAPGRSFVRVSAFGRWARFDDTAYGDEPSIVEQSQSLGQAMPRGIRDGYSMLALRGRAAVDTRDESGVPSAGVRVMVHGELAGAFGGLAASRWFVVGGQLLGATDFLGGRRTITASVEASTILPVAGSEVPFDQTIDAGGSGPMQGYLPGHLRGGSAVAATLAYEWPIWLFLNARLYATAGNAFGYAFEGLAAEQLRLSFGLAVRPPDAGEHPFELGLGFGTDPIADGASISSFRFYVGARNDL